MKIRFKDFKIDFSKRDVISTVCFTVVMILVLILGNSFGYVSADGGSSDNPYFTKQGYESSSSYNSSNLYVNFANVTNNIGETNCQVSSEAILNFDYSVFDGSNGFDSSAIKYYVITGGVTPFTYTVWLLEGTEDSCIFYNGNSSACCFWIGDNNFNVGQRLYYCNFTPTTDGTNVLGMSEPTSLSYVNCNWMSETSTHFYTYNMPSTSPQILLTNMELLTTEGQPVNGAPAFDVQNYLSGGTSNNIVNVNYKYGDVAPLGGLDNLEGVSSGSGVSSETALNNMYLDSCKFTFNFNNYVNSINDDNLKYKGNWNKGNITFDAILNDYQIENASEFTLHIQFQVLIAGRGFRQLQDNFGNYYLGTAEPFGGNYTMNSELTYSLSSFHSSNDSLSWNADTLYNSLYCSDSILLNYNHSLTALLSQCSEFAEIDWSGWKIYANAWLTANDSTSDRRIDSYNYLTGVTTNSSDALNYNDNPYVGDDSDLDSIFENDSDSETSSDGKMVQNNNQTVTITNSNSNVNTNDISNVINNIDDEGSSSLIGKFSRLLSLNSWVAVLASALSFMPAEFWTELTSYFSVCLGILSTFLVLRYIFNLLS